jgi:lipoprotein-releasing system permease protein
VKGWAALPLYIGLRYSFSRKRTRFTALVAQISMLGMVLGVASLITVLSVMNGFAGELRDRVLALVPHAELTAPPSTDWPALAAQVAQAPGVIGVAPFVRARALIGGSRTQQPVQLRGVDPQLEPSVSALSVAMVRGGLDALREGEFGVVLGSSLARSLGVGMGERVLLTLPALTITPLGVFPRSKRLVVVGLFQVGAQQDADHAYIALGDAQRLLRMDSGVTGLQLRTVDLFAAPQLLRGVRAQLPEQARLRDWSQLQSTLFNAVRMEKLTVSLLLLSVIAVAAFNIVSTLVMSVAEKRRDIAVLRTLGASAARIMAVFVIHGLALALLGILLGAALGGALALNIAPLAAWLEALTGRYLFDPSVYFISSLPSRLLWSDVAYVVAAALVLSLLATLYPAWRASRIAPAEVLRYG